MVKLCVFDLDGTLLDTLKNIAGNLNQALETLGIQPFPLDDYRSFVGNGAKKLVISALSARGLDVETWYPRVFPIFAEFYEKAPDKDVTVYEGMLPLLTALRAKGILCAVNTNKPDGAAQSTVSKFFPADAFATVLGAGEEIALKPSADGVRLLMKRYGVKAEETVFVGDSDVDMQTACNAGVRGFGATWGFRTPEELMGAGATALLLHPTDLLAYLD